MAKKLPLITDFDSIPEEALVPGAEQPYEIPSHWKWVRFGSINSYTSRSVTPANSPSAKFTLFSVPSFAAGEPELLLGKDIQSSKQMVELNDVLVCKINPRINRVWVVDAQYGHSKIASSEWIVFRPTIGLAKYFQIYFSSPSFRTLIESEVSGVGGSLTRARPKLVAAYPVPLPPVDEQRRIVDYIGKTNGKIDDVIQRLEQYLEAAPARRNELIQAGVNGHLTSSWRRLNCHSRQDWDRITLGDAFKWSSGGTPSRKRPEYYEGTIPWIKSGELRDGLIFDSEEHITEQAINDSSAKLFPEGSVLIAMYGATIGKTGVLGTPSTTNQAIACALPSQETLAEYLVLFLRAQKQDFISLGKGGAQPNISQTVIKGYSFQRPSLEEQKAIVDIVNRGLNTVETTVDLVTDALDRLRNSRENMIRAVLSGSLA